MQDLPDQYVAPKQRPEFRFFETWESVNTAGGGPVINGSAFQWTPDVDILIQKVYATGVFRNVGATAANYHDIRLQVSTFTSNPLNVTPTGAIVLGGGITIPSFTISWNVPREKAFLDFTNCEVFLASGQLYQFEMQALGNFAVGDDIDFYMRIAYQQLT